MSSDLSRRLLINILWSFLGRFGYLTIGLITNIILVRLLSPKEFGQVGIMMFFIAIASVLMESGLSGALVRKQDAKDIDYSTIFIFNLSVSLILMALLIIASGSIAKFYQEAGLQNILIASSIVLLINALRVSHTVRLIKELQFKKKSTYEFIAISIGSLIAVFLAANGAGVWALVALQLSTSAVLTIILWLFVDSLSTYRFSRASFKEFYKFGINTTLASLLNAAFDNVYQLILGKYFSITQTGYFYQAKKLQEMPTGIIQSTALGVVYSALAKLQDTPAEFNVLYQHVVKVFTIVVALICLLIYFYAEIIIISLYGELWLDSVYYLKLLIVAAFFLLQEMFNRIIFKIFNRTDKILQLEVVKKLIQSLTIIYGVWTMSIENLIYGFVITSVISFFINYYYARKIQNNFNWHDFTVVIKIAFSAVSTVFIFNYIEGLINFTVYQAVFLLPGMLLVYFLGLRLLDVSNFYYDIKNLSSTLKGKP